MPFRGGDYAGRGSGQPVEKPAIDRVGSELRSNIPAFGLHAGEADSAKHDSDDSNRYVNDPHRAPHFSPQIRKYRPDQRHRRVQR